MKKLILILALAAPFTLRAELPKAATTATNPAIEALTKELEAEKARAAGSQSQVDQLKAQQQQQAVITEYYKTVAERNEALLRIVQLQTENAQLKSEVEALKAKAAPAAADAKK